MPDDILGEVAVPEAVSEAPERSASTSEAVERAFDTVFGDDANDAPVSEDKPEGPARGPDGKFAPKEASSEPVAAETPAPVTEAAKPAEPAHEAPARFSPDAKAAWEAAPPAIKGEVRRAITELEGGLEQYRRTVEPLKAHLQHFGSAENMAAFGNNVAQFEAGLRENPAQGFARICEQMQIDPRAVAAQIMGQPEPQRDQVIESLRAELAGIKQQVGGVQQTFEQQRQQQIAQTVQQFEAANPRFEELAGDIAQMLRTGFASDLQDAYDKASRLNPAPAPAALAAAPGPQTPAPVAQPRKSDLSVNGAPSSGSNPANRQRSATSMEAIDRAFEQVGLPTS